ncbi:hypothetical protein [Citreimonas salinaria]|uniref:Uncharacterized protein n=1 Tax=Citreimonas salinaria TaxID=321339 RepID=A0A1H3NYX1_9RHOB|nr:hypothetical protein [Citreimonas salinaria]SDY93755.1 hypothetical protein SAMN05444340_1379 [Citreimonas salinaria]
MIRKVLPIHTIDARDNVMLEVLRDYFRLSPDRLLFEIQGMRKNLVNSLKRKGVNYDQLRAALVPDREKLEIALIFDTTLIENYGYGCEVFKHLIPLLNPHTNNSILHGDYRGDNHNQDALYEAFHESACPVKTIIYQHSTQFYVVYINNLTDTAFQTLADGMMVFKGYVGCANTTYSSRFKTLLSTRLTNLGVKFGRIIIQGHEDDRDEMENVNMCGFPFEDSGYKCISIRSSLADLFLSYKIERPIYSGFEADTEFCLNSVNSRVADINNFDVQVENAKLEYLKTAKAGSLHHAGLSDVTTDELQGIIRGKLRQNYIYNMSHLEEHNVTKFSIIIEVPDANGEPFRLMAALEYRPDDRVLRLITFY